MEILQVVAIGLVSVFLAVTIKKQVPEFSLLISVTASVIIFLMILPKISAFTGILSNLQKGTSVDMTYINTVLKIIGIAYIAEFGSQVCIDAGESSIASKIELFGKVLIMALSIPIMLALLDLIINSLP
jgi:stage III sporulation protein AD